MNIKIDKLIRSRRRTIGLQITSDARLIVRAPVFVSEDHIHRLISRKGSWIKAKQDYFKERQNKVPARNLLPGEAFLLKAQALEYITLRVEYYAQMAGVKYKSIRINNAKTRWGSCGYKDTLNFTWRLMMAPARVVDYVIVHELMHLKQKNHSHQYWAEVEKMMPDYKQDERWLKQNGHLLV
jgi:predicted metal-dependent hydrolase